MGSEVDIALIYTAITVLRSLLVLPTISNMNILKVLLPTRCILCDLNCDQADFICEACHDSLPHYQSGCTGCGIIIDNHREKNLCGSCILSPPPFDNIQALFEYEPPISLLIHQLKFSGNLLIARFLATKWIDYLKNTMRPDLILPVPLHHTRLSERGFNQALEIAKPIGKYFQIPIDTRSCIRIKNTQAQSSLPASKRKHNLKNAFGLSRSISVRHVAILDDVVTTGNTISEIAHLLRKVGVEQIDTWCCARARK